MGGRRYGIRGPEQGGKGLSPIDRAGRCYEEDQSDTVDNRTGGAGSVNPSPINAPNRPSRSSDKQPYR